jgi:hypothetical protein
VGAFNSPHSWLETIIIMIRKHLLPAAIAVLLTATGLASAQQRPAAAETASAQSGGFSLTAGIDYSTGKYGGTSSTDILYVPLIGKYETDKWVFKLTVPYIMVSGPGNVVRDVGIIESKTPHARQTESGLGDIVLGVSRNLVDIASTGTLIDLTGKIKFGTADAGKALGTGENDYAAQVDVTQRVMTALSVFGSLGYKIVGSPSGADLRNVVYGEAGAVFKVNPGTAVGAYLDASQAPSPASGPVREVTAYLSQALAQRWKLQVYGVHGFANGSPDWGGGAMATYRF